MDAAGERRDEIRSFLRVRTEQILTERGLGLSAARQTDETSVVCPRGTHVPVGVKEINCNKSLKLSHELADDGEAGGRDTAALSVKARRLPACGQTAGRHFRQQHSKGVSFGRGDGLSV